MFAHILPGSRFSFAPDNLLGLSALWTCARGVTFNVKSKGRDDAQILLLPNALNKIYH